MTILPKKQKLKLINKFIEEIIKLFPSICLFLVISIIGTCLRWSPETIVKAIAAIAGNNAVVTIVNYYKDSKKTN